MPQQPSAFQTVAADCPYSSSTHLDNSFQHNINSGSYADNFHVYEIHGLEDNISWYVDNIQVYSVNPSGVSSTVQLAI